METYRVRIIFVAMMLFTATANAETIVQYDGSLFTPSTQASGISGGTMTNASLNNLTKGTSTYSTTPIYFLFPASGATSATSAVTANSYFSFSVTPTDLEMDLTSLTFSAARGGSGTPRGYAVRSSIDSYAANIATANLSTVRPTWTDVTIDLSGASYQNLTSVITFRIYAYSPGITSTVDMDAITLNGTLTSTLGGGGGTTTSDSFDDAPPTLTRYVQMQRSGTTLTAKIYSDENYSVLLDTLTVTASAQTYRYLYSPIANNTGVSGSTFSGSVSNLDVAVQLGSTCDDVCTLCSTQALCETGGGITCYWWDNNSCQASSQPASPAATIGVYMTGGQITGCQIQ